MENATTKRKAAFSTPKSSLSISRSGRGSTNKRIKYDFKSPVRTVQETTPQEHDCYDESDLMRILDKELADLREKDAYLQTSIDQLTEEGLVEEELNDHITKLHEYNEIKDIGQMLLGKIALERGVTTKSLYETYGLNLED